RATLDVAAGRVQAFGVAEERVDVWSLPIEAETGRVTGVPRRETSAGEHNFWPSASRDGSHIAHISDRSGRRELWVKDLRSGDERPVRTDRSISLGPRMRPDGGAVAYTIVEGNDRVVYVADLVSGNSTRLCGACGYPWDWTPDREALLADASYDGAAESPQSY